MMNKDFLKLVFTDDKKLLKKEEGQSWISSSTSPFVAQSSTGHSSSPHPLCQDPG